MDSPSVCSCLSMRGLHRSDGCEPPLSHKPQGLIRQVVAIQSPERTDSQFSQSIKEISPQNPGTHMVQKVLHGQSHGVTQAWNMKNRQIESGVEAPDRRNLIARIGVNSTRNWWAILRTGGRISATNGFGTPPRVPL
jgi:hypothetical protein